MLKSFSKKNVSSVVNDGLCTSCGICAGACQKNCITFYYGETKNIPQINEKACVNCGLCYDICPGKGLQLNRLSNVFWGEERNVQTNLYTGHYLQAYVGHSTNDDIRIHGATGGMVSQFLIWLLKKNEIEGAVVVRYRHDNPFETEAFIATTEKEIWESRSSKYVVLSMDKVANKIATGKYNKLVVVGVPCQIQGWRMLANKNPNVRNAIKGFISIYCSINKIKSSIKYYPWRYRIKDKDVSRFTFRDDGCMGYMKFIDKNGQTMKKIPYLKFWFGTHSFFTNSRCSLCIDQLGELADVSFGDINIEPYSQDEIGTNSLIVRSTYWKNLLIQCKEEGAITLDEIEINTLISSQQYVQTYKKGAGVKANFILRKLIGKKNPVYDYKYPGDVSLKIFAVEFCKALMRLIGKHPKLWWVVKAFDKDKNN